MIFDCAWHQGCGLNSVPGSMLMSLVFPCPFSGPLRLRAPDFFDGVDSDEGPATPTCTDDVFSWTLRVEEPNHQDLDRNTPLAKAVTLHVFRKHGDGVCD